MQHVTSIGLDVHARSIAAAAFDPFTGEVVQRSFGYSPAEVAEWVLSFESPKAVYESGVTGFHLARELRALGVDCVVGAVSKMQKPAADRRRKNDRADAAFLARLLASHNVVEVYVPDEETEAARDYARVLEDIREDLVRAKQRLSKFLLRHGLVFDERDARGRRKGNWTAAHWRWIDGIGFDQDADMEALKHYKSEVRRLAREKSDAEKRIASYAKRERWSGRVEALRCLKGVETATAFAVVVEAGVFSRFPDAPSFAAWTGLVPSEHSSGESERRGGITKAGNSHVRKLLVESAWHYAAASPARKENPAVPVKVENHAAKGTRRLVERRRALRAAGKRPVVANCATARELACWMWALGRMCEGTL